MGFHKNFFFCELCYSTASITIPLILQLRTHISLVEPRYFPPAADFQQAFVQVGQIILPSAKMENNIGQDRVTVPLLHGGKQPEPTRIIDIIVFRQ